MRQFGVTDMFDEKTMNELLKVAVINALGEEGGKRLVGELITKLTSTKVNRNGHTAYDSFGGNPDTPLLDYLLNKELKLLLEQVVRDYVKENSEQFREQFRAQITADEGLAKSMTDFLVRQMSEGCVEINVGLKER